ncbi:MAG: hypothetical protein HDR71_13335 [Lachnospiraceae bacterium]|nr:hypothetical protein [Lachnospiraceae bacterium]
MKVQPISYDEYKYEVMRIYRDLRREGYYYNLLILLLEECIEHDMKVVPVYLNTGYKDDGVKRLHDRSKYADSHSLQDIIIVPEQYEYEKTTEPYVSIEVKKPDILFENGKIVKYNSLKAEGKKLEQLQEEFRHCQYIIFTDCITWYFLRSNEEINKFDICLIDDKQWKQDGIIWEKLKDKIKMTLNESKQIKV